MPMTAGFFEFLEGILVGAGGILPGISGAALAVVFGLYEEFTALLAHPKREWKNFLARRWILCLGIGTGFIGFTILLKLFFAEWTVPLIYLFSGFIAGTLPTIWRSARKRKIGPAGAAAFFIAAGALLFLAFARHSHLGPFAGEAQSAAPITPITPTASTSVAFSFRWIFSGALIGTGSLLPGFSASFVLIMLGWYEPLLDAAGNLDLGILAQLGAGLLASVIVLSRFVHWLYGRFHDVMSLAVLGFTLGSLVLAFPGLPRPGEMIPSILLALAGLASSLWLESRLN